SRHCCDVSARCVILKPLVFTSSTFCQAKRASACLTYSSSAPPSAPEHTATHSTTSKNGRDCIIHIPTKQKRRSTGQGTKSHLDHQRPEKNGSRMAPAATSFRAPSECHGCRRTRCCEPRVSLLHAMG